MNPDCLIIPGPHTIFGLYVSDYHWLVWRYFWHIAFRLSVFSICCSFSSNFLPHEAKVKALAYRLGYKPHVAIASYRILVDLVAGLAFNWRYRLPSLDLQLMGFRPRRSEHRFEDQSC